MKKMIAVLDEVRSESRRANISHMNCSKKVAKVLKESCRILAEICPKCKRNFNKGKSAMVVQTINQGARFCYRLLQRKNI
jgi:hypothetical protein